MILKVLFPAGVPGAVEIPIESLKVTASAAGVFIEAGNLRGLTQLFDGMRIPLIHYPEAARQIAIKALAFPQMTWIGQDVADYLAAGEMLRTKNLLEVCRFAADGRPGAARQLVDFADVHDDAFTELIRHTVEGNEDAMVLLVQIHWISSWRKRTNILAALSRFHGVTFDLWLRSALKKADAKLRYAVFKQKDIGSMLSASLRNEKTLRQAAELKERMDPGWDDQIVRYGPKILKGLLFPATVPRLSR